MPTPTLEHANVTVRDLDRASAFVLAAAPHWRRRGDGAMDWFGKPVRWVHLGDDHQYLTLQDGGEGALPPWQGLSLGVKHLGLVVADLDAAQARLQALGHAIDHPGVDNAVRRSVYYSPDDLVQIELVQYLRDDPAERNQY